MGTYMLRRLLKVRYQFGDHQENTAAPEGCAS
jgi:hypothetical protein